MNMKSGDKVRINSPKSALHGMTATVQRLSDDVHIAVENGPNACFQSNDLQVLPDHGEGWRLLDIAEQPIAGDEYWIGDQWVVSAAGIIQTIQAGYPHRRRIPAPFRISTHGPGIYERRNGKAIPVHEQAKVDGRWYSKSHAGSWRDDGHHCGDDNCDDDLVRFIGPLPAPETFPVEQVTAIPSGKCDEPETWTPTGDIQWMRTPLCTPVCIMLANGHWCQLMREFKCGDETEWRPVGEEKP